MTISSDSARINDSFNKNSKIFLARWDKQVKIPAKARMTPQTRFEKTAADFCKIVDETSDADKALLPVFVAARFGKVKSEGGSFRHNGNVEALTGIFFDYDGELINDDKVSLEDIEKRLKASGYGGIIYPTSSYAEKKSWRLLLPFKTAIPFDAKTLTKEVKIHYCEKLLQKLGLLGIIDENYGNISIPFAFGCVRGSEVPAARIVEGRFISDEIEQDIEAAQMLDLRLSDYLGIEEPVTKSTPLFNSDKRLSDEEIEDALSYISATCSREEWVKILAGLFHDGRDESIARNWSQSSEQYDKHDFDRTWDSFERSTSSRSAGIATVLHEAQANGWTHPWHKKIKADANALMQEVDVKKSLAKKIIKKAGEKSFRDELDLNSKGFPIGTAANLHHVLMNDPNVKGAYGFNEFELIPMQRKATQVLPLANGKPEVLGHLARLKIYLTKSATRGGIGMQRLADSDIKAQVAYAAELPENRYHPVREYLQKETWDGQPRVDSLFVDYLKCDDNTYTREAARLFLVAAVARVMSPTGQQFDNVPIIGGQQNARKTSFVRTLAKGLTGSLHKDLSDIQKTCESMRGKWIVEVAELKSFRHSDIEAMKDFFSAITDTYRRPYRPDEETFIRQCVFIGTTNASDYLIDPTGNRRFWPIDVPAGHKIDTDQLAGNLDQIWAEALVIYNEMLEQAGGNLRLNLSEEAERLAEIARSAKMKEMEASILADRIVEELTGGNGFDAAKPLGIKEDWVNSRIYNSLGMPEHRRLRVIKEALRLLVDQNVLSAKQQVKIDGKNLYLHRVLI